MIERRAPNRPLEVGPPDFVEGKEGPELRGIVWSGSPEEPAWFVIRRGATDKVLTIEFYPNAIASELRARMASALEPASAEDGSGPVDGRLVLRRNTPSGEEEEVSKRLAGVLGAGWEPPIVRLLTTEPGPHRPRRAVRWYGIPREQVPWYPIIDPGTCDGCGKCVEFCPHDALGLSGDPPRAEVTHPFNCLVGCDSCTRQCPENAIRFPPREILQEIRTGSLD